MPILSVKAGTYCSYQEKKSLVQSQCGKVGRGQWVCITHQQDLYNRNAMQMHTRKPQVKHVLAWECPEHGLETT